MTGSFASGSTGFFLPSPFFVGGGVTTGSTGGVAVASTGGVGSGSGSGSPGGSVRTTGSLGGATGVGFVGAGVGGSTLALAAGSCGPSATPIPGVPASTQATSPTAINASTIVIPIPPRDATTTGAELRLRVAVGPLIRRRPDGSAAIVLYTRVSSSSAPRMSAMLWKRSSGCLLSARMITRSTELGMLASGATRRGGIAVSSSCIASTVVCLPLWNGQVPVSSSYSSTPTP